MTVPECTLDISNVSYSASMNIGGSGCISKTEPTAVLRDVSARVHGGEVLAVLGSKGSGKRALLDVIAGRAIGETRGRISLGGSLLTPELFRRHGGYVAHRCYLLSSLTVRQTLTYSMSLANLNNRELRVRQTLADLALSQVANRSINDLTKAEYRRIMLGVQLAKDPMLLLLDEPTWDTDPLNTYLIVSMLWSYATKRGSIVVLTMETPRSDVLPFVSRVTLLCLGAVVYSGPTRSMLDYFAYVGFPCPELENPLMYYLCLSTVDRRSRERFLESNQQISVLVEKFKIEGNLYMKEAPQGSPSIKEMPVGFIHKGLGHGIRPGCFSTLLALYLRGLAATFSFNKCGLGHFAARLLILPFCLSLLSILYSHSSPLQSRYFMQTGGLVFNCLALFYIIGIATTALLFPGFRARYYQEKREGLYGGTMFLTAYTLLSLPLSFISTIITVGILVPTLDLNLLSWAYASGIFWSSYIIAEQLSISFLMVIKRPFIGAITALYFTLISLLIASGGLRSIRNLPNYMSTLSNALPTRYASLAINELIIDMPNRTTNLAYNESLSCPGIPGLCRYANGGAYIVERFIRDGETDVSRILNVELNLLISLTFALSFVIFNSILYLLPLPSKVKAKFRE
ncbi:hypothetical protein HCN44_004478 [Aphidius gifuensis]|uniref:ABC transporter domain-containing protein n=1 Tax=Aphidius gifuensis TaxID=684658 RepID=A0A834XY50_APHGI|nr:ATP-binding cassette sub-family G member 5 [Aphidius gifuensis]KAF7995006.1 hypothetical protein HCN44_004478 [Aphidius gifuensis]